MNRYIQWALVFTWVFCFSSCSLYRMATHRNRKSGDKTVAKSSADSAHLAAAGARPADTLAANANARTQIDSTRPGTPKDTTATVTADTATRQLITQLTPIWEKRIAYNTFSGKAKMRFDGPDGKQEFTAHIRIRKDSVIWINVTAALGGISVARVLITPDSFFLLNYLEKEITREPLSYAIKILPTRVDFSSLQNLITGEPLRDGNIVSATDFGGSWTLQVEDSNYVQRIAYNKTDSTMRTGQLRTRKEGGPQAMSEYGDYMTTPNGRISTGRVVNIQQMGTILMRSI